MKFYVISSIHEINGKKGIYLLHDNWDDWFEYEISYNLYIRTEKLEHIGRVKIAKRNQEERLVSLPKEFEFLSEDYFSIGFNEEFYEKLKKTNYRELILKSLNDIAFNLEIYEKVKEEMVTQHAIMRDYSAVKLKGSLNRLANGKAKLTDFNLQYILPYKNPATNDDISMDFEVIRRKKPHSNIHVLVGKNGIGKTTLLKNMVFALESENNNVGSMNSAAEGDFANIVFVSFSAFDKPIFEEDLKENHQLKYNYVGLINKNSIKSRDTLTAEFIDTSFKFYANTSKMQLWEETLLYLSSDETFDKEDIYSWISKENKEVWKADINNQELTPEQKREKLKEYHTNLVKDKYTQLSSGHKIILLTLANLVNLVEEKTVVLIDEPEEHLHPPLVAAFIQALSNILVYRNGMGIIATHSPVVVQEVPKKCVWILRRFDNYLIPYRPEFETYGENLGELTTSIFGYEVENSGFHKELLEAIEKTQDYENSIKYFDNQLGKEAKSILRAYTYRLENHD